VYDDLVAISNSVFEVETALVVSIVKINLSSGGEGSI
jgi:hypothetical protein